MNLSQIKEKALREEQDISEIIDRIKKIIDAHPNGWDVFVPDHLINNVISYCDSQNIPCYHVSSSSCSVARTYSALLSFEERR